MTSRNLRISWLTTGTAALEFNKENLKGYSAIRMRLVGEDTSLFSDWIDAKISRF